MLRTIKSPVLTQGDAVIMVVGKRKTQAGHEVEGRWKVVRMEHTVGVNGQSLQFRADLLLVDFPLGLALVHHFFENVESLASRADGMIHFSI